MTDWRVTDEDIRNALKTLSSMRKVSRYLGVTERRVEQVKRTMTEPRERSLTHGSPQEFIHNDETDRRVAARLGSEGLLRALLRYGFSHDGLPGMSAEAFLERASEMGVSCQ